MNLKLKSYLSIILFLIIGMIVMALTQLIKTPDWLNPAFVVLVFFIVINLATEKIFKLNKIQTFWSIKKIYFLPIGILVGGLIVTLPTFIGLLTGATNLKELHFSSAFTLASVFVTLAIVTWEELWFRGTFLNYCNKNLSAISISIAIGLLFMLIHMLNPEIDLLKTGPTLFFAGAFLTIVYFYFKSIWLPIGLHFGNNYFTIQSNLDKHSFFGNEGYLSAIILAVLFLLFVKLTLRQKTSM